MIDYATEVIPGKSAKGYKDFNSEEWFFKVHSKMILMFQECYR